jgi:uncharacterized membrane protein YqjE
MVSVALGGEGVHMHFRLTLIRMVTMVLVVVVCVVLAVLVILVGLPWCRPVCSAFPLLNPPFRPLALAC